VAQPQARPLMLPRTFPSLLTGGHPHALEGIGQTRSGARPRSCGELMDVAILGAGGVGGYYGGVLARAGHHVRFWARGANLEALRRRGLEVRTPEGTFTVAVTATESPEELGRVGFALVSVKSYSLPDVAGAARTVALKGATLVPLLNGVDAAEHLVALGVPREALLGGLTMISVERIAPGVVERKSAFQSIVLGELDGGTSSRAKAIVEVLRSAGVETRESTQMEVELWQKFIFIASMATVCGLARAPIGRVRSAPGGVEFVETAVGEAVAVGRARGVRLPDDQRARTVATIQGLPAQMRPSFLVDFERGGATEIDALMGTVSRLGHELGVPTPVHSATAAALAATSQP
jgi:2-dehydropantoate 2-reductase